jgi:hypothetical protein
MSFRDEEDDGVIKFAIPLERAYSDVTLTYVVIQLRLVNVTPLIPPAGWTHPTSFSVICDQTGLIVPYIPPSNGVQETVSLVFPIPPGTKNRPKTEIYGDYPVSWLTFTMSHRGAPDASNPIDSIGAKRRVDTILNIHYIRTTLATSYANGFINGSIDDTLPVPLQPNGLPINGQHCTQESVLTDPASFTYDPIPGLGTLQNGWFDKAKTESYSAPVVNGFPPKFYIGSCAVKLEAYLGLSTNPRISSTTKIMNNPLEGQVSVVQWTTLPKGTTSVRCTVQNFDPNGGGIVACVHAGVKNPNGPPINDFNNFVFF